MDPRAGKIVAKKDRVEFFVARTEEFGKIPQCSILEMYEDYPSLQDREIGKQVYGDIAVNCFGRNSEATMQSLRTAASSKYLRLVIEKC